MEHRRHECGDEHLLRRACGHGRCLRPLQLLTVRQPPGNRVELLLEQQQRQPIRAGRRPYLPVGERDTCGKREQLLRLFDHRLVECASAHQFLPPRREFQLAGGMPRERHLVYRGAGRLELRQRLRVRLGAGDECPACARRRRDDGQHGDWRGSDDGGRLDLPAERALCPCRERHHGGVHRAHFRHGEDNRHGGAGALLQRQLPTGARHALHGRHAAGGRAGDHVGLLQPRHAHGTRRLRAGEGNRCALHAFLYRVRHHCAVSKRDFHL